MLRVSLLYIGVIISAVAGLIFGNEAIRLMMAVALLAVAVPLWMTLKTQVADLSVQRFIQRLNAHRRAETDDQYLATAADLPPINAEQD